ncbi:unnamed protein product [Notodromas monacha]|uniref:Uncharacterized protein n=1 Tax=Notodromas monacha TaxID=399045 RepID=A0A7R9BCW8_9CRUS|nr:unnamed protein product [Notodromas monacha]CAG0912463.1 unnamed protein product [Notodromas monacha]
MRCMDIPRSWLAYAASVDRQLSERLSSFLRSVPSVQAVRNVSLSPAELKLRDSPPLPVAFLRQAHRGVPCVCEKITRFENSVRERLIVGAVRLSSSPLHKGRKKCLLLSLTFKHLEIFVGQLSAGSEPNARARGLYGPPSIECLEPARDETILPVDDMRSNVTATQGFIKALMTRILDEPRSDP